MKNKILKIKKAVVFFLILLSPISLISQERLEKVGESFSSNIEIYNFFKKVEKGQKHSLSDTYVLHKKVSFDDFSMFYLTNGDIHSFTYIMFKLKGGENIFIKKYEFDFIYKKIKKIKGFCALNEKNKNELINNISAFLINRFSQNEEFQKLKVIE